jgi:hypothetical protein
VDDDIVIVQSGNVREGAVIASFKALFLYPREENESEGESLKRISCNKLRSGSRLTIYIVLTRVIVVAPNPLISI